MPKVYLISDTHFNHRSMIFFGERPFTSLSEMHRTIVENWNSVVGSNDIVIIAGDFGKGSFLFFKQLLEGLNGEKILIKGNHDYWFRLRKLLKIKAIKIHDEILLRARDIRILITHKPQDRSKKLFDINIHGHHHRKLLPKGLLKNYYYNVAVEHNNYKPKLLLDIIKEKGFRTENISLDFHL